MACLKADIACSLIGFIWICNGMSESTLWHGLLPRPLWYIIISMVLAQLCLNLQKQPYILVRLSTTTVSSPNVKFQWIGNKNLNQLQDNCTM